MSNQASIFQIYVHWHRHQYRRLMPFDLHCIHFCEIYFAPSDNTVVTSHQINTESWANRNKKSHIRQIPQHHHEISIRNSYAAVWIPASFRNKSTYGIRFYTHSTHLVGWNGFLEPADKHTHTRRRIRTAVQFLSHTHDAHTLNLLLWPRTSISFVTTLSWIFALVKKQKPKKCPK